MAVARTTSRPPWLTVAPVTSVAFDHVDGHGLSGQHRFVDRGRALLDDSVGRDLLTGAYDEQVALVQVSQRDQRLRAIPQHGDIAKSKIHERSQGGAGLRLGAGLEVVAGEDEHRDRCGDLEVDLVVPGTARQERELHLHAGLTGVADEQCPQRPEPRGADSDADERVHRRGAMTGVDPGGLVERVGAPDHHGRGEGEREPLPVVELQRRDHREQDDRDGQRGRDLEPLKHRCSSVQVAVALMAFVVHGILGPYRRGVAGLRDGVDQGLYVDIAPASRPSPSRSRS